MEKQTKNLGHVTAYGYAKSQGYEGTEAEYAALMASYATVAERAEAAAEEAEESAQEVHDVIPEVTAQDNGKVMMVENGEWGAGEVDVLPPVTSQDNGKVLGVVEGQWAKTEPEDGLPEVTSSDNGKVLSVVEGAWAPAEPTGGSGLPEVTSEDNGDILSVVDGAWAKSEPGYRVENTEGAVIAAEQSVTTAMLDFPSPAAVLSGTWPSKNPDSVKVTLNGTEYTLPNAEVPGEVLYGEVDQNGFVFTTYPCAIYYLGEEADNVFVIVTPDVGTYTVSVSEPVTRDAVPTEDFKLAVKACGAPGYDVSTEDVEIAAEQSVTTASQGSSAIAFIAVTWPSTYPDSIVVTLDGTEYTLPKAVDSGGTVVYGEVDGSSVVFTTYPCAISGGSGYNAIATPEAKTYSLRITASSTVSTPDNDFTNAVRAAGIGTPIIATLSGFTAIATNALSIVSFDTIFDAYTKGRPVFAEFDLTGIDSIAPPAYGPRKVIAPIYANPISDSLTSFHAKAVYIDSSKNVHMLEAQIGQNEGTDDVTVWHISNAT